MWVLLFLCYLRDVFCSLLCSYYSFYVFVTFFFVFSFCTFCFLLYVLCVLVLFCVLFFLLYTVFSFLSTYKYTDHCHLVELQFRLINVVINLKAAGFSETSISFCKTTRRYLREDLTLYVQKFKLDWTGSGRRPVTPFCGHIYKTSVSLNTLDDWLDKSLSAFRGRSCNVVGELQLDLFLLPVTCQ